MVYAKADCPSEVELGIVRTVEAESIQVQELVQKAGKVVTFLPRWLDLATQKTRRGVAAKLGEAQCLEQVAVERLIAKVVIQDNFTLDSESRKYMESLSVVVDLVASGGH